MYECRRRLPSGFFSGTVLSLRERNREHAETAYGALLKFLPRVSLTDDENGELADGIEGLRRTIAAIPRPRL